MMSGHIEALLIETQGMSLMFVKMRVSTLQVVQLVSLMQKCQKTPNRIQKHNQVRIKGLSWTRGKEYLG